MPNLLPPNATSLERHVATLTERLEQYPSDFQHTWHPDLCPVELLPWLAWAFSVDEWDVNWTEAQKRNAIKNSVFIHKHKGTRAALERALANLVEAEINEWFEHTPPTAPYTFTVNTTLPLTDISADSFANIMRVINAAKNLRSHYTLQITTDAFGDSFYGGSMTAGYESAIYPYSPSILLSGHLQLAGALSSGVSTPIYPFVP